MKRVIPCILLVLAMLSSKIANARMSNEHFLQVCANAAANFNGPNGEREISFDFVNSRGKSQKSNAKYIALDEVTCVANWNSISMVVERREDFVIRMSVMVNYDPENESHKLDVIGDCEDKTFDHVKKVFENKGGVRTLSFDSQMLDNIRNSYCPRLYKAVENIVSNEVI